MHIRRQLISILILGALTLGLSFLIYQYDEGRKMYEEQNQPYTNKTHGISFIVPSSYLLTEREIGNKERSHYSIVLIRKEDDATPQNGEGPPSISIDIYDNSLDKQTLANWLVGSSESNFKLSNGDLFEKIIDGIPGLSYTWSGLYEGESVALLRKDTLFLFSVTYLQKEDMIRTDFENIIKSVKFN